MYTTKKLMTVLLAMLACMSASAQVKFGAKVGLDLTNFWGKECGHQMVLNYQAGLIMEYRFSNAFAVAPEVVFAAQGGKYDVLFTDREDYIGPRVLPYGKYFGSNDGLYARHATFHMNYIDVPIILKYYVIPSLSIDFGPQVGFNVYSKMTLGEAYGKDVAGKYDKETIDLKDDTKSVDFGLGLGASYNLTDNAFVQARYTLGLTNVIKGDLGEFYESKNGNIQLAFGMKF